MKDSRFSSEDTPLEGQEEYSQTTEGIEVTASPTFLPERSEKAKSLFAYSYRVRIVNTGDVTSQLINRHWKVISGGRQIADVKGEGVIGEQPVLQPGEAFEYESWTIVHDPIGSMLGTYTFVTENGVFFDVTIPEFPLIHISDMTVH
ncbi:MAG: Co2+/Mg2+ efflux protein ApaG [Bdellovibrionales bacterium]|nr:Co2+/Mg2+ efflux protein ApaG [Bdellovibrionales bacterium]